MVARSLPNAPNPDVPFFLDDPVILNYEFLRAVWLKSVSISSACARFHRSKADFHRLERSFIVVGLPALFPLPKKLNLHDKLERLALCDPGPLILAQFIDDLGVCEALQVHGPPRPQGAELTNVVLLNICRILAGYETLNALQPMGDRSVAFAAGVGIFPGTTTLYEKFGDIRLSHLQALRNDAAARARELGLIRGERIALDFHFKELYGQAPDDEEIGRGPNASGEICPGFRPHVAWDLDTDVLINIAFCNGAIRATTMVRQFCEKDIFPMSSRTNTPTFSRDSVSKTGHKYRSQLGPECSDR